MLVVLRSLDDSAHERSMLDAGLALAYPGKERAMTWTLVASCKLQVPMPNQHASTHGCMGPACQPAAEVCMWSLEGSQVERRPIMHRTAQQPARNPQGQLRFQRRVRLLHMVRGTRLGLTSLLMQRLISAARRHPSSRTSTACFDSLLLASMQPVNASRRRDSPVVTDLGRRPIRLGPQDQG
ncbi:hypothetical protein JX266_005968 [Neoarthrinium moseri]|nr:hypothetical protein JX266_005968 [Neoarthrinium moseri]